MDTLNGFEELSVDKEHSQVKVPIMHVELALNARYFIKGGEIGYCRLLINGVKGSGLRGRLAAAAAKNYIGRTIFCFVSQTSEGKKLITVPALFEKEPTFDDKLDLGGLIINTYFPDDFKKSAAQVHQEHLHSLNGKQISNDKDNLKKSLLELPKKGIEILKSYR
ncbi:MAG: hypothetical protein OIN86_06890 [Candidatus Methanoperedens sp.]|nr:hypothetical protein [Candidatus Methanoperedens sp.]CAG1009496.1 hypothetical protein METP1_03735 [Methanosarcinales archaeon]